MNKQIKELALQAGYSKDFLAVGLPGNMERFAELIVRECEQVSLAISHRDDDMGAIIARRIKHHFGVEE